MVAHPKVPTLLTFFVLALAVVNNVSSQPSYLQGKARRGAISLVGTPAKVQVRVIPVNNLSRDYVICVAGMDAGVVKLQKTVYSLSENIFSNVTDIILSGLFLDFYLMEPGTLGCKIALISPTGEFKICEDGTCASQNLENLPLKVAIVNTAVGISDSKNFIMNSTHAITNDYSVRAAGGNTFGSLSAALWQTGGYVVALQTNGESSLLPPQVFEKGSSSWSQVSFTKKARQPSVSGWAANSWIVCFDTGANAPPEAFIYCKVRGLGERPIDDGAGPRAFFSQTMVSTVHPDYALVSTVGSIDGKSTLRVYVVNRTDSTLVPGSVWLDDAVVNGAAHHSAKNLVAVVRYSTGVLDLAVLEFMPALLSQTAPGGSPATPAGAPDGQNPSSPSGSVPTPVGEVQGDAATPGLGAGAQAGIAVATIGAGLGAGLFVLLFMLKKKRDRKKKEQDTPMDPANGPTAGTYGNLPTNANGTYGSINTAGGKYGNMTTSDTGGDDGIAVPTAIQPSEIDKRLHIPYKSLVFVKEIGAGSYGKVYLGEWRGAKVAIKVNNTVTDVDGFLAEAKLTLGITPHPNLVQTFGVSLDGPNPSIVLEYCGGGSLDQTQVGLSNEKRLEFALKIGYGLLHLHSRSIVHRDLAARNILLTNDGTPKISDFGMSRIVQEEAAKGRTKTNFGPIRWMAPECLKDKSYSLKSDVWSFGMILYEMVSGKEPHEDADQLEIALKIRDKGVTPEIPEDCDPALRECMQMCWKFNPSDRPTIEEVCEFLRSKTNIEI